MTCETSKEAYVIEYKLKELSGRKYIEEEITNKIVGYVAWINRFFEDANEEIFKRLKSEELNI